jgi:hypothetical protein
MKYLIKSIVFLLIITVLSSCTSYRNLNKKEPVTSDFLSSLQPNKRYKFELKSGDVMYLRIQSISDGRISGYTFKSGDAFPSKTNQFSDSIENIERNVSKVSRRKFNPGLTVLAVGIPAAVWGMMNWPFQYGFSY